jgi:hypothetical protein
VERVMDLLALNAGRPDASAINMACINCRFG